VVFLSADTGDNMNRITFPAAFVILMLISCNGEKEEPSDAGMDVQITPDASGDSDTDSDTDSDMDSDSDTDSDTDTDSDSDTDADAGTWQPIPDGGKYCGEHCRQVTFTPEVQTTYDLNNGYLAYKDNSSEYLWLIDLENEKQIKVADTQRPNYIVYYPTINSSWVYYILNCRRGEIESTDILYRRNIITWELQELKRYKYEEEHSPFSLLARGDYVCMNMSPPLGDNSNQYIECINPETKTIKTISDQDSIGTPIHNGEHVAYVYMIPNPPFGSGTHIKVRNIEDGGVAKLWDYLGDKGRQHMSSNGLVWIDLRNDTLGNKNGNASIHNSDIYYLDLQTMIETPLCTNSAIQDWPAIDGNLVAWEDQRNSPDPTRSVPQDLDIYLYNLETKDEVNLTEGISDWKFYTRISGKWLTFQMPSDPGINIFAVDLEAMGLYSE